MQGMNMEGARFMLNVADYNTAGAIHMPEFEPEILDMTRKRSIAMLRTKTRLATGHPTRYWEKTALSNTANFVDPRNLTHLLNSTPTRVERAANIKGMMNGIQFGLFDRKVTKQQGKFENLMSEDMQDMVMDLIRLQDRKFWTGAAANLMAASAEYCGVLTQIQRTATIPVGSTVRISQAIKTEVAKLAALVEYDVKPSIIFMNPMTLDILENEELNAEDKVKFYDVEVVSGIKVIGIMTAAGILPIVCDPYIPVEDATTKYNHKIVVATEDLIERQYVDTEIPEIHVLGTEISLAQKIVAVQFDTIIVKGADYGHVVITKEVAK